MWQCGKKNWILRFKLIKNCHLCLKLNCTRWRISLSLFFFLFFFIFSFFPFFSRAHTLLHSVFYFSFHQCMIASYFLSLFISVGEFNCWKNVLARKSSSLATTTHQRQGHYNISRCTERNFANANSGWRCEDYQFGSKGMLSVSLSFVFVCFSLSLSLSFLYTDTHTVSCNHTTFLLYF